MFENSNVYLAIFCQHEVRLRFSLILKWQYFQDQFALHKTRLQATDNTHLHSLSVDTTNKSEAKSSDLLLHILPKHPVISNYTFLLYAKYSQNQRKYGQWRRMKFCSSKKLTNNFKWISLPDFKAKSIVNCGCSDI